MKYLLSALSFSLLLSGSLNAQDEKSKEVKKNIKKQYSEADGYWEDEDYDRALPIYVNLQNFNNTPFLKYKIGDCYANSVVKQDKQKAMEYLKQAADSVDPSLEFDYYNYKNRLAPIDVYLAYGKILRTKHNLEFAKENFVKYQEGYGDKLPESEKAEVIRQLKICETAKLLIANPVDIIVTSLGTNINSKFPEFAPVLSADEKTLIYTSRRPRSNKKVENAGQEKSKIIKLLTSDVDKGIDPKDHAYYEDIYISNKGKDGKWGKPKLIDEINTPGHEASIGLSVDGQQLLIYSSQEDKNGDIYYSKLEGSTWTKPISFDALNSNASETHACFSADGKTIYFTSNRKGGYGSYDVYRIVKLPNGEWSLPQNLGPKINTSRSDRAPFIHPDGVSLFFSSEGHETMGGFDIFQSTMDENGVWSDPENIGYPINTTEDDVFYVTSVDGKRSYYSSEKESGNGKDIFLIELPTIAVNPLTVMSGTFSLGDKNGTVPDDAQIIVTDNENGTVVGIYKPNKKTGKYLFILPPGRNYNVTYEAKGYLFKSENLIVPKNSAFSSIKKEINLAPIKANESIVLNNVFFEFNSALITKDSKIELDKLFSLLANNPAINVEIQGHTDSKGRNSYNKDLSQKRAESVRSYVIKKGISSKRVTAKGYGEKQPIARNENADGTDNEEGRALNRRIELKILSQNEQHKNTVNEIHVPTKLKK
jgi:outer membrane protein OmpA-like peptidoglycan-associated protein